MRCATRSSRAAQPLHDGPGTPGVSATRGLTLDAGALIAFERGEEHVRLILRRASAGDRLITGPATIVAEGLRRAAGADGDEQHG
jgi:hypothetical protein